MHFKNNTETGNELTLSLHQQRQARREREWGEWGNTWRTKLDREVGIDSQFYVKKTHCKIRTGPLGETQRPIHKTSDFLGLEFKGTYFLYLKL